MTARAPIDPTSVRRARAALIDDPTITGRALAARLAEHVDTVFEALVAIVPDGWAIAATGGYAAGVLCPGSDVDVVLLHPADVDDGRVRDVAEALWYPFWDGGLIMRPSAQSRESLLRLAEDDLVTATSILDVRCVGGNPALTAALRRDALAQWRAAPERWLRALSTANEERWQRCGDVSSLLEPDLKDGRGGLRDIDSLGWALATGRDDVAAALDALPESIIAASQTVLAARCEVHRTTGRASNVLLLQDQDRIAAALGFVDADAFMLHVATGARTVEWASTRFWRRVERMLAPARRPPSTKHALAEQLVGVSVVAGEVEVSHLADLDDQSLAFRVAALAARAGLPLSVRALRTLASCAGEPDAAWTDATRRWFLRLLGTGTEVVAAVEALEQYGLFSRLLPEWREVRSRPQRNAFHIYNVDRHLLQTVANTAAMVRDVARPDLLLVAALLHDIGKGRSGDHTAAGMQMLERILPRIGFDAVEIDVLRTLVQHHLLLAETATRRDLSDPRTTANVADAVVDTSRLELLRALTEADSLATGPSAWSSWKQSLIAELIAAVEACLQGAPHRETSNGVPARSAPLLDAVRANGGLQIEHEPVGDLFVLTVATADRPGLFSAIAGTLALHGVDVVTAEAWTSADAIAVDRFVVTRAPSGAPNVRRLRADLDDVLAGRVDVATRLESRMRTYARASRRAQAASAPRLEVLISNDASDSTTMIDVRAPDAQAVLYRLSATLAGRGFDIRSAKVATLGHEVVDVFYVRAPGVAGGQVPVTEQGELRDELKRSLLGG